MADRLGVSKATVAHWGARDKQNIPISCAGRLRKLSERDAAAIARMVSTGKLSAATAIQQVLKYELRVDVHRATVARSLKRSGLTAFAKRKKPLLSAKHRKARLDFAKKYRNWTVEDWDQVLFSNETKFNRWGLTAGSTAGGAAASCCKTIMLFQP
jgi:transposase